MDIRQHTAQQYRKIRRILKGSDDWPLEDSLEESPTIIYSASAVALCLLMAGLMIIGSCCLAHAQGITDQQAVKAILGEAEGESFEGMVAIGGALRNRGSLRGVYGYKAITYNDGSYYRGKRRIADSVVNNANIAWLESNSIDESNGGTGWGNESDINKFCSTVWWHKCIITAHIGNHWFYRQKRG